MHTYSPEIIEKVIALLHNEIIPAEGCTEPIAIAYAAAKATEVLGRKPERMNIYCSGNIIKNVKSVIVPNSGGMVGIGVSAAMGAFAGNPNKELMVISDATPEMLFEVKEFLSKKSIHIQHAQVSDKLYIQVKVFAGDESASVELKKRHTNVTAIKKNDQVIFQAPDEESQTQIDPASILSIKLIYDLSKSIDISLFKDLLDKVISCNSAIATEGLTHDYGVNIGRNIQKSIQNGFYNLCNGANLAYTKAAFLEVDGFRQIDHIPSGDDMMLMHKMAKKFGDKIAYLKNKDSIVYTSTEKDFVTFWNQRVRWTSKSTHYEDKRITGILAFVYLVNLLIVLNLAIGIFYPPVLKLAMWMFLAKLCIDTLFTYAVTKFFRRENLLWLFLPMQAVHVLYIILIAPAGVFGKYNWKGRRI